MFWTAVWFIVNMLFVSSAIVYLFTHRAVAMAHHHGATEDRLKLLKRRKKIFAYITVIMFAAMCGSFVINMKLNG